MEFVDTDGDRIQFVLIGGKLREYCNGKLDVAEITWLQYSRSDGRVVDKGGSFSFQASDHVEKALGLRALAVRAGVAWLGDEPEVARQLVLTDTDGDRLEFSISEGGQLQELNNGKVELEHIQRLKFSFADGTVHDETGVFTLPPGECVEKVAALRSLAALADVEWVGDDPFSPPAGLPTLDIEDCPSKWELQCPKRWESLEPTRNPKERFCDTCKETVYFCTSAQELEERTAQRRCVAFDIRAPRVAPATGSEAGAASASAAAPADAELVPVRVLRLSGEALPPISLELKQKVLDLKRAIAECTGIPPALQRLFINSQELVDGSTLALAGVTPEASVQMVRMPAPDKAEDQPPRRKMGKRRM